MDMLKTAASLVLTAAIAGCATVNPWCNGDSCEPVHHEMAGEGHANGGSADYEIPLDDPADSGFRPVLSVEYSSRRGNGDLGMGWSVSEYSSVFRCPATPERDGFASGVRYTSGDTLCLDGDHLIPVSGGYGEDGTVYRTEIESFTEIRELGDIDSAGSYFIATYKNGNKAIYKTPVTPTGATAPLTWAETWLEDTDGDAISYNYVNKHPGELLLSEIRYAGHDIRGDVTQGDNVIRYEYETRPDINTSFLAGGETLSTERLSDILMGVDRSRSKGGFEKRIEYDFHYIESRASGRSLLSGIMHCVFQDQDTKRCDTPTMITWQDRPVSFEDPLRYGTPSPEAAETQEWHPGDQAVPAPPFTRAWDYDGDGRTELLYAKPGVPAHLYFTDLAGKVYRDLKVEDYVRESGLQWTRSFGDFMNLGAADLFGAVGDVFGISYWDGQAMVKPIPTEIPYSPDMLVADFNGDDYQDVLQLESSKAGDFAVRLYLNQHSTPGKPRFSAPLEVLRLPAGNYSLQLPGGNDIDGNGCADALLMQDGRIAKIVLFSEDATGAPRWRIVNPSDYGFSEAALNGPAYFADINGDGLSDIVYTDRSPTGNPTWHYQLNTGNGYAAAMDTGVQDMRPSGAGVTGTLVADIANDGKDELIYPATLLQAYCLSVPASDGKPGYRCSDDELGSHSPTLDLGIYRFAVLKFSADENGRYTPTVLADENIVAQANVTSAGDMRADGLTNVFAPFDPWFKNGWFRAADGKYSKCPIPYGCGLHMDLNVNGERADNQDAAPDMVLKVDKGQGTWAAWHYYPLANPVRGLYSVPPLGSPERYIDQDSFYFTSSMYVVGDSTAHDSNGTSRWRFEYGGAAESAGGGYFEGFRWIVQHYLDNNVKAVQWYMQSFPYDGELVSQWMESESASGDDYLHGVPGDQYFDYIHNTYDCQGPGNLPMSAQARCVNTGSGAFLARKRISTEILRDPVTHKVISNVPTYYDYDAEGNLIEPDKNDD